MKVLASQWTWSKLTSKWNREEVHGSDTQRLRKMFRSGIKLGIAVV
jgi:hypothetical protein